MEKGEKEERIDLNAVAKKWQKEWEKNKVFHVKKDSKKKKYYVLEMFPYPSASFLHMGHVRNYTIGDVFARHKRMQGFNVLYPMGYDSFGLPAENAAKKEGIHPRKYANDSIKKIIEYQKALGNSYDWRRVISTCEPEYYKWNQFFFTKMMEKGLVYRKKAPVNWCPNCESVLANEEAEGGKCWRCGTEVVKKDLEQWFMKITAYSDELLEGLKNLDWPDKIKAMQENWIGKSYGVEINFSIDSEDWAVFTTRIDTIFGVTFMVISAQHPKLLSLCSKEQRKEVEAFAKKCSRVASAEEENLLEKEGVFTGKYAVNPLTKEKVPVYAGNFVVADYGCGMVMAVPAHDQRDYDFAKKYKLEIREVIKGGNIKERAYVDEGVLVNSGEFSGMNSKEAIEKISDYIEKKKLGKRTVNYKIRDWLISRQRYWGTPIPVIYCERCAKKKQKVLIIHGFEGKSNSNWFPWLKKELEKQGFEVLVPDMPNAAHPRLEEWMAALEKIANDFDGNDIIIGHSLGGNAALHLAERKKISSLYLIAPAPPVQYPKSRWDWFRKEWPNSDIDALKKFHDAEVNFAKVEDNSERRVLILSDNDPYIPLEAQKLFDDKRWEKIVLHERGHILEPEFKELFNELMKDKKNLGIVPVPEKDLPVLLPENVDFKARENPLLSNKKFLEVKCPRCNSPARRETDTMGGFVDSSWYFLRYCSPDEKDKPFDKNDVKYWMPVDQYIGGAEHAVMHLIYARFFTRVLRDLGYVNFSEPFTKLFNQGIVYKDGHKMSKSFGNVVFQTDISEKYGIDTARLFLMFVASPDKQMEWSDEGVEGSYRIIMRMAALAGKIKEKSTARDESRINITIKKVTEEVESFQYPKAVIAIIEALDYYARGIPKKHYEELLKMFSIFCPHIAEELWHQIGNSSFISAERWPKYDYSKIEPALEELSKRMEILKDDIRRIIHIAKQKDEKSEATGAKLIVSPSWKYKAVFLAKKQMENTRNTGDIIKALLKDNEISSHAKDVPNLVGKLMKNSQLIIQAELSQEGELSFLKDEKEFLEDELSLKIALERAEDSAEGKKEQALPGKPAIVIKMK
ncbi:leucine--tRNA ligase [Candidatus Woesearchaeota archaeon CG07_land_8_20_14_0_80_44_23]|nr:MAG: leucine--tRNA ligase [Candidatus Woesearchaeota archaeon CG07_land_8_20_14_0_80_44_23]